MGISQSKSNDVLIENSTLLTPEDVYVNGQSLESRELSLLLSCPNPPRRLKAGHYWYDKHAGFWGKKGQKPSQIISANMNLGGFIDSSASNGKTQVHINGREITEVELIMLKLVGVNCYRDAHFWMNEDGSYQEEAGKPTKRSIWDKAGAEFLCSVLSLPFPPDPRHA